MSIGAIATSLNNIAQVLRQNKVCQDVNVISQAARNINKSDKGKCHYKVERLIFNIPTVPRNSIPSSTRDLKVIFNIEICEIINSKEGNIVNPILKDTMQSIDYNCNFTFIGKNTNNKGDVIDVVSSMHFDYDNVTNTDFDHPDLHMTFGGDSMLNHCAEENQNEVFGKTLILTTPRIPHPPMDAILGIDFILRNFFKKEIYNQIKADSNYRNAIKQSQERLWKPYMLALAGHWCKFAGCKYEDNIGLAKKYNPSLAER